MDLAHLKDVIGHIPPGQRTGIAALAVAVGTVGTLVSNAPQLVLPVFTLTGILALLVLQLPYRAAGLFLVAAIGIALTMPEGEEVHDGTARNKELVPVAGVVHYDGTSDGVPGAEVSLARQSNVAYTDSTGSFVLEVQRHVVDHELLFTVRKDTALAYPRPYRPGPYLLSLPRPSLAGSAGGAIRLVQDRAREPLQPQQMAEQQMARMPVPMADSRVRVILDSVRVSEDGARGEAAWKFDVRLGETEPLRLGWATYDDRDAAQSLKLIGAERVLPAAGRVEVRIDGRKSRSLLKTLFKGMEAAGRLEQPLPPPGEAHRAEVRVYNPEKPQDGDFTFYFTLINDRARRAIADIEGA